VVAVVGGVVEGVTWVVLAGMVGRFVVLCERRGWWVGEGEDGEGNGDGDDGLVRKLKGGRRRLGWAVAGCCLLLVVCFDRPWM
jgi:hypothetical protein